MSYNPSYVGTMSSTVIGYAKDYLQGSQQDYLFWQADQNDYYLCLCDHIHYESGQYVLDNEFTEIHIVYDPRDYQIPNDEPTNYRSYVTVYNQTGLFTPYSGELFYCSIGTNPRLQEGGEFYGFAAISCMCIGFCFVLVTRLFRRLV